MTSKQCFGLPWNRALRMVGDPVDVISGAQLFYETDFRLQGDHIPISWTRHYDSRRHQVDRGVGHGFRLSMDVELRFDLDGMCFSTFEGEAIEFPFLDADGERQLRGGYLLERLGQTHYLVHPPDEEPSWEFRFAREPVAKPSSLFFPHDPRPPVRLLYEKGLLTGFQLDASRRVVLEYAGTHLVGAVLLEAGNPTRQRLARYQYDAQGHLIQMDDAYGGVLRYGYDKDHRLIRLTDRRGYSFLYEYDSDGRCIHSRGEDGVEDYRFEYKPLERLTVSTRADGAVTSYYYDEQDALVQIIDACGGVTAYLKDDDGRVVAEIDPNGNKSTILYNERGLPYAKCDPLGHVRRLPVDPTPHPLSHRTPESPVEWEHGDWPGEVQPLPDGVPVGKWLPRWLVSSWGETPTTSLPEPAIVKNVQGLPVREERKDGKARRWTFDPNGYYRWYQDFDGNKRQYEYKSWNHLVREQDALGAITEYGYTIAEEIAAIIDPLGTQHRYDYDAKDRLVAVRRHGKVRETYKYDAADNLIAKLDGQGKPLLTFAIGPGNLTMQRALASGDVQDFAYTKNGRIASAKNRAGLVTFAYKNDLRVADERDGKGVRRRFVHHRLARITVLGRFITKYIPVDATTTIILDPGGQTQRLRLAGPGLVERACSNNVEELSQYDVDGRCLLKATEGPGMGQGWARRFEYSGEGDLLRRHDNQRGLVVFQTDANHRLTATRLPDGNTHEYAYDKAGNLLRAPGFSAKIQSGNRLWEANGDRFSYNDRDHVAEREGRNGKWTYGYDSRDLLVSIEGPGLSYQAVHDGLGRRTRKVVNGQTWQYYWDTDRLAAEVFPDGRLRVYVYPDGFAAVPMLFLDYDSIAADPKSGKRYHVHTDHLGCPELIVDDLGQVVWKARIEPYGTARIEVGADFHQPIRWPGHYYDAETGLHDNRFRTYSPELGRYLQSDPIGVQGGLNLYAYTDNPTRAVDLRGHEQTCPVAAKKAAEQSEGGDDKEGTKKPERNRQRKKGEETELVDAQGKPKKPLSEMSDQELQDFTQQRSKQLNDSLHPQEASRTTTAVMVVENPKGDKSSRKVVITSSENREPTMPNKVGNKKDGFTEVNEPGTRRDSALAPGEEFRDTPPHLSKKGNVDTADGTEKVDLTGEKGRQRDYFDENNKPYTKAKRGEELSGNGSTEHHAEQRAQNSLQEGEHPATLEPTKVCCAGCNKSLSDSGNINAVRPDMRGPA